SFRSPLPRDGDFSVFVSGQSQTRQPLLEGVRDAHARSAVSVGRSAQRRRSLAAACCRDGLPDLGCAYRHPLCLRRTFFSDGSRSFDCLFAFAVAPHPVESSALGRAVRLYVAVLREGDSHAWKESRTDVPVSRLSVWN